MRDENHPTGVSYSAGRLWSRLPGPWRRGIRFAIGVWIVWGLTSAGLDLYHSIRAEPYTSRRLQGGKFCRIWDILAKDLFAPTQIYLQDEATTAEERTELAIAPLMHYRYATLPFEALVIVDRDDTPSSLHINEHGVGFDYRLSHVQIVTGPLTGRHAMVERYKLQPLD